MARTFSQQLRGEAAEIWRAIHLHRFLQEVHCGSLPLESFTYFILQDYRYLLDFAQVLCAGASKAGDLETLEIFARHALMAVEVERTFHSAFGKSLGLSARQLDKIAKGPVTEAYTKHLQAVARSGTLGELVAAILPCYWVYGEVGKKLYPNRPKKPKVYRQWIETYASEDYWKPVREQIQLMNRLGARAKAEEQMLMQTHFLLSSRYEFLFWEQAYHQEKWPI